MNTVLPFLLVLLALDGGDPLAQHAGGPVLVEFPTVDDIGAPLSVPDGWLFVQADADTVDELRARLGTQQQVALFYIDRFGNVLHSDSSGSRRQRVSRSVREFQRKQRELEARLGQLLADAQAAAERGSRVKEVAKLGAILDAGVSGYPAVHAARMRWEVLDREVTERLLATLATEGLVTRRELQQALKALAREASGLPAEQMLQRELHRLKRGFVVQERSGG